MKNKEIFDYILTSLQFIGEWTKNSSIEEFEQDLMLMDAVAYRLYSVGVVAEKIDLSKLEEKEIVVFNKFTEFKSVFANPNFKINLLSDLIFSNKVGELFSLIFFMYIEKFEPNDKKQSAQKKELLRDYNYPSTTRTSIWTVKKR